MTNAHLQLVERINRIVGDRGDVDLVLELDRIMDKETEEKQASALAEVVRNLHQQKTSNKAS